MVSLVLSAGLAVASVGLPPVLSDSPVPVPLPSGAPSVSVQVSAAPPLAGVPPVSASASVRAGPSASAALAAGRANVAVGAGSPAGASTPAGPASGGDGNGTASSSGAAPSGAARAPGSPAASGGPRQTRREASAPAARLYATSEDPPVICAQLVFRPLVAGCQALLGPITGSGLAPTGTPVQLGLAGLLLILVGLLTSWWSRRRGRTASRAGA